MTPFHLKIVTPDGLIYDGQAEELLVRTTNGDVGIIPDPDKDPGEDLKAEAGEWGMPLQRELRATLHSYMED